MVHAMRACAIIVYTLWKCTKKRGGGMHARHIYYYTYIFVYIYISLPVESVPQRQGQVQATGQ